MNRRGFIGALAVLPIAAVVMPKVSVPEATAAPIVTSSLCTTSGSAGNVGHVTITIHCDTRQFQRNLNAIGKMVERELQKSPLRFGLHP